MENPYSLARDILLSALSADRFTSIDLYGASVHEKGTEDGYCSRYHLGNGSDTGDIALASHSGVYAWWAAGCSILSILLYFLALCCSHLAAFRTATNMKKAALHHTVTLPLGYFSQNASGRLEALRLCEFIQGSQTAPLDFCMRSCSVWHPKA